MQNSDLPRGRKALTRTTTRTFPPLSILARGGRIPSLERRDGVEADERTANMSTSSSVSLSTAARAEAAAVVVRMAILMGLCVAAAGMRWGSREIPIKVAEMSSTTSRYRRRREECISSTPKSPHYASFRMVVPAQHVLRHDTARTANNTVNRRGCLLITLPHWGRWSPGRLGAGTVVAGATLSISLGLGPHTLPLLLPGNPPPHLLWGLPSTFNFHASFERHNMISCGNPTLDNACHPLGKF